MTTRVLISFFCEDRPGVIKELSGAIASCDGNWLDSQLSQLGGRFAGILQAHLPEDKRAALEDALVQLKAKGITATLTDAGDPSATPQSVRRLTLVGPDRPGIVHELTRTLSAGGFNVLSLDTQVEAAPMSGEPMFSAKARIEIADNTQLGALEQKLELMSEAMTLEIDLVEAD
jgi:glycine cleavage system regulatory protein